jgi:hypothetical protein
MTKKMCRIIGSRRNIVVAGTNNESIKAFSIWLLFASLVHCVALPRSQYMTCRFTSLWSPLWFLC